MIKSLFSFLCYFFHSHKIFAIPASGMSEFFALLIYTTTIEVILYLTCCGSSFSNGDLCSSKGQCVHNNPYNLLQLVSYLQPTTRFAYYRLKVMQIGICCTVDGVDHSVNISFLPFLLILMITVQQSL